MVLCGRPGLFLPLALGHVTVFQPDGLFERENGDVLYEVTCEYPSLTQMCLCSNTSQMARRSQLYGLYLIAMQTYETCQCFIKLQHYEVHSQHCQNPLSFICGESIIFTSFYGRFMLSSLHINNELLITCLDPSQTCLLEIPLWHLCS